MYSQTSYLQVLGNLWNHVMSQIFKNQLFFMQYFKSSFKFSPFSNREVEKDKNLILREMDLKGLYLL